MKKLPLHINALIAALSIALLSIAAHTEEDGKEAAPAEAPAEAPTGPVDVRQVQVKVWISETTEYGIRDIGANLNFTRFVRGEEQSGSVQQVLTDTINPLERFGTAVMPFPDTSLFGAPLRPDLNQNLADGLQTVRGAGLEFSIISTDYGTVDGLLQAMERRT
ncbi:MAG TPA: hypothetical protein ENN29_07060, partial [Candidatus Hydrogenedentes bacterium]|nr:hypothetical protein [Candidatus Hydrogenedentota bacterium]